MYMCGMSTLAAAAVTEAIRTYFRDAAREAISLPDVPSLRHALAAVREASLCG